ncbi:hypothetical protein [Anaerospora hongkongensis]|uniref:hypothetical protein n=1 Tax=Anaerospora hongkongensis TaxID=244830 RepID=UPI00289AF90F|nr:hypothetical protein [Anaerospora hongkongensis]
MTPMTPLRKLRLEAGYKTIREVEQLTGIRKLGAMEAQQTPLTEKAYTALAQLYGCSVYDII